MKRLVNQHPRTVAWVVFFGGLAALLIVDHIIRVRDGQVQDGGLPQSIYYGVPVLLGAVSVYSLSHAVRKYQKIVFGVLEALGHLAVGTVLYFFALLFYVVETGIDSL